MVELVFCLVMTGVSVWVALEADCLVELDGLALIQEIISSHCLDFVVFDVFSWPCVCHKSCFRLPGEFIS